MASTVFRGHFSSFETKDKSGVAVSIHELSSSLSNKTIGYQLFLYPTFFSVFG